MWQHHHTAAQGLGVIQIVPDTRQSDEPILEDRDHGPLRGQPIIPLRLIVLAKDPFQDSTTRHLMDRGIGLNM
jgi:hypothetical protein